MHQEAFGGRSPLGLAGELLTLQRPRLPAGLMGGTRRHGGRTGWEERDRTASINGEGKGKERKGRKLVSFSFSLQFG